MIPYIFSILSINSLKLKDVLFTFFDSLPDQFTHLSTVGWLLAGFLVGFGTKLTHGLTTGHGYCAAPII